MSGPLIRIDGLFKVFGPRPETVMDQVRAGAAKAEILAESGHTVGLRDIDLDVAEGGMRSSKNTTP